MGSEAQRKVSPLPGLVVTFTLSILAVLSWPGFVQRLVSFDWKLGNMRPVACGLQVFFGVLAVISLLAQARINDLHSKWFPTKKHLLFAAFGFSLSTVLSLLAVEVGFRVLHFPFTEELTVSENALAQFDPELGWAYVPNRTIVQEFGSDRHKVAMSFDNLGCRVRAPGLWHDPAAPTVLFVGDSFTFGHGLPYEETFVGRLEAMAGFPFQVVNLGVQGYGTDQSLLLLKHRFKQFNTKFVVYTFIDEHLDRNRVADLRLFHRFSRFLATKPVFGLRPDGRLYLKEKPVRYEDLHYSHLWACIQIGLLKWGPKPSFDLTRAVVREMKNYVESNGAKFFVVYWERSLRASGPSNSPFSGMNLDVVDAGPDAPPGWFHWTIPGDGHPDARAHAYVARLLLEALACNTTTSGNVRIR